MDLRFRKTLSAAEVEQSVDRLEEEIRKRHPDVKHVFISPTLCRRRNRLAKKAQSKHLLKSFAGGKIAAHAVHASARWGGSRAKISPSSEVPYILIVGRKKSWPRLAAPPLISPPTRLALRFSSSSGDMILRWMIRSLKPGAKRSICFSMLSAMLNVEPCGT